MSWIWNNNVKTVEITAKQHETYEYKAKLICLCFYLSVCLCLSASLSLSHSHACMCIPPPSPTHKVTDRHTHTHKHRVKIKLQFGAFMIISQGDIINHCKDRLHMLRFIIYTCTCFWPSTDQTQLGDILEGTCWSCDFSQLPSLTAQFGTLEHRVVDENDLTFPNWAIGFIHIGSLAVCLKKTIYSLLQTCFIQQV